MCVVSGEGRVRSCRVRCSGEVVSRCMADCVYSLEFFFSFSHFFRFCCLFLPHLSFFSLFLISFLSTFSCFRFYYSFSFTFSLIDYPLFFLFIRFFSRCCCLNFSSFILFFFFSFLLFILLHIFFA